MNNSALKAAVVLILSLVYFNSYGEAKYKGCVGASGAVMTGDTYNYVMGCDGKIGFSIKTEQGICFNINSYRPDGVFFGAGIGFDYVNVALSDFDQDKYETTNILSNSIIAVPIYLTVKYIYTMSKISMVYQVKGGYYKWYRGHILEHNKNLDKNYDIPYQGSYMFGFGIGLRFPINEKYGVSLMFDYDYMGANMKGLIENISNNKTGISVSFDF